ncbi:hypothetical protein [Maricaulis sp.]|uniref:hypothetical protein n=1 Tax=unclassified Maricaulis TaxID=2632371 RepID=UPI001B061B15|nr:hypothetical protein [Maricaulis sp.]MBO6797078.1 hypothetical protein [Maricaulis sp.]
MFHTVIRPVLAWAGACLVATLLLISVMYTLSIIGEGVSSDEALTVLMGLPVAVIISGVVAAFILAVPSFVIVMLLRLLRLPRGWGDGIAGAALGAFLVHNAQANVSEGYLSQWQAYAVFATIGLLAGLSYWSLAGRPDVPVKPI